MHDFPCDQCGICCQKVNLANELRFLDRGDGVCKHYDHASRLCSIYNDRPDICRVDRQYEEKFVKLYSWEEFVEINVKACEQLKSKADSPG